MGTTYNAEQAAQLTSATISQIEYLNRTKLITPAQEASRRGVSRQYDVQNLLEIAVAGELLDAGIGIININKALILLRENWKQLCDPRRRDSAGVLVLWRNPLDQRKGKAPSLTVQIGYVQMLELVKAGYAIHAAVPVGWMAKQIETVTRERLA